MQVTLVISRFFENSRAFARAAAREVGVPLTLLEGDTDYAYAMRTLRCSRRVWFEGVGPLVRTILAAPEKWTLPRACLRVAEEEIAQLPLPGLWSVVADLIVPDQRAGDQLVSRMAAGAPPGDLGLPPWRLHVACNDLSRQILGEVLPGEDVTQLVGLLLKPPGELARGVWRSIAVVAEACRGRVLVLGAPPAELTAHLTRACGLEVAADGDDGAVDTVVLWRGPREDGADEAVRRNAARLRPDGSVITVAPAGRGARAQDTVQRATAASLVVPAPAHERAVPGTRCHAERSEASRCSSQSGAQPCRDSSPPQAGAQNDSAAHGKGAAPPVSVHVRPAGPLVSAVIPVYNDADRVGRAIVSLRRQTYPHLEIVVVDDGSTDGTAQAVGKHLNDPRVRYLYKPHSGRPETRNLGVREARGEFVAWLGSDDESYPTRLQAQVEAVRKNPGVDIVHTDGLMFRTDGTVADRRYYRPFTIEEFPRRLLAGFAGTCPILDTSALIRRSVYDRVGLYDPVFLRCQDYDFYVRTAMAGDVRYAHVPLALVKVYMSPPSPEKRRAATDYYATLALRVIRFFGPERLTDPLARDLHIPPYLVLAEYLANIVAVCQLPPGHILCEEAHRYLLQAGKAVSPLDRSEACKILAMMARAGGDEGLAELCMARAGNLAEAALGRAPVEQKPLRGRADWGVAPAPPRPPTPGVPMPAAVALLAKE